MIRDDATSRAHIMRVMLEMAGSPEGLSRQRAHDRWSGDNRVRAKAVFAELTRGRRLYPRHHRRTVWWFATRALAAAWAPPADEAAPTKRAPAACDAVRPHGPAGEPRRTVCDGYTHDKRFQLAPGSRPPALFSALGVGRYLKD